MRYKLLTALLLSSLLGISCGKKKQNPYGSQAAQPQAYPTEELQPRTVELRRSYPVMIRGQQDIEIRPRVDGFIKNIFIDEGSQVRKGQVLFSIDSPASLQAYQTARASVEDSRANLNTARLNVDRMRPLAEQNIISNVQLETYRNQYESAQAAVSQAEAALNQSRAALSWTNVTSPVDGVAGEIPYRQGSLVSSSNVLTTVANTTEVYAYFSLNEKELLALLTEYPGTTQEEKMKNMPAVSLILSDGSTYPHDGRITTISGVLDANTGTAQLRADFPNPGGILRSGMSGRISIPRYLRNVLEIPQKSTFSQQDKTLVYKVQADSVVQTIISVEPTPDGINYAVTDGLSPGDRIVTDGIATLTDGKKIRTE